MATDTRTTSSTAKDKDADKDKGTTRSGSSSSSSSTTSRSSSGSSGTSSSGEIKTSKDGTPSGSDGKPLEGTHSTDVRENTEDERKVQPRESGLSQPKDVERPYTVEDDHGIERVVTTGRRGWKPRPSDPHPELVKRAKDREKEAEKVKKERQTPISERAKGGNS